MAGPSIGFIEGIKKASKRRKANRESRREEVSRTVDVQTNTGKTRPVEFKGEKHTSKNEKRTREVVRAPEGKIVTKTKATPRGEKLKVIKRFNKF